MTITLSTWLSISSDRAAPSTLIVAPDGRDKARHGFAAAAAQQPADRVAEGTKTHRPSLRTAEPRRRRSGSGGPGPGGRAAGRRSR